MTNISGAPTVISETNGKSDTFGIIWTEISGHEAESPANSCDSTKNRSKI